MVDERTPPARPPIEEDRRRERKRTPRQRPPIPDQLPSDTSLRLARAAQIINQIASVLGEDAGKVDQLQGPKRAIFLTETFDDARGTARDLIALIDDIERAENDSQG